MPCILSPDWKLHRIPDDKTEAAAAVAKLVMKELNIGWRQLVQQLCGLDAVRSDRTQRKDRRRAWMLLSLPRWLKYG